MQYTEQIAYLAMAISVLSMMLMVVAVVLMCLARQTREERLREMYEHPPTTAIQQTEQHQQQTQQHQWQQPVPKR